MHPDLTEASQCLQSAESLLDKVKAMRREQPTHFLADAQQKEHYRLQIAWELLLSAKAALIRAEERGEGDTAELWVRHKRLKAEYSQLNDPVDEAKKEARRAYMREWAREYRKSKKK